MAAIIPVVLAGGAGTRLWPVAREEVPKQFHAFGAAGSMLKQTVARLAGDERFAPPLIACGADHRAMVEQELAGAVHGTLLLEPVRRNTAPAIAAAAEYARSAHGDSCVIACVPVDHAMNGSAAFRNVLADAARVAESGKLVVVGIVPTRAETGYGYIECGAPLADAASGVTRFVEKPDAITAQRFLDAGNFLWNAGVVVSRADVLLRAVFAHSADVGRAAHDAVAQSKIESGAVALDGAAYAQSPSISFDYAVLEMSRNVAVVRGDFGWADLGTWNAIHETQRADENGNVLSEGVYAEDCRNVYVRSDRGTVAIIGLEDVIVVRDGDAVLIAPRSRAQEIGKLGAALGKKPGG